MEAKPKKRQRVFYFDLIRAFSCLCIMTVHFNASISGWTNGQFVYGNSLVPNYYLNGRVYLGGIGVSLFFMLSGATLMMSYRGGLKRFYIRRFRSIYPMFWVAYIAVALIDFMLNRGFVQADIRLMPLTITGMDGYLATLGLAPYGFYKIGEWFLGCIVLLYLVYPAVHACLERAPAVTAVGSVVLAAVLGMLCERVLGYACSGLEPWFKAPEMIFGMLFVRYSLEKKAPLLAAATGACLALIRLLHLPLHQLALTTLLCIFLFALLTALSGLVKNGVVRRAVIRFAALSYPIFLLHHWIIARMVQGFRLDAMPRRDVLAMYAAYMIITLAASAGLERIMAGIGCFLAPAEHKDTEISDIK